MSSGASLIPQIAARCHSDERPALDTGGRQVTARQLVELAEALARQPELASLPAEAVVAIEGPASAEFFVAAVACRLAGASYLPFDRHIPAARLRYVLDHTNCHTGLVTTATGSRLLGESGLRVREIADVGGTDAGRSGPPRLAASPSSLHRLCLMFTSGTTGHPKGVEVLDRGVARLSRDRRLQTILDGARVAQLASVAFDASHFELWATLCAGGTLVFPEQQLWTLAEIADFLLDAEIDVAFVTSGLFTALIDARPGCFASLRHVLTGGDVVSPLHIGEVLGSGPTVWNCYGPTECTTFTLLHRVDDRDVARSGGIPIGTPIAGTKVAVDAPGANGRPAGVGELVVGGAALARGYLDAPEETSRRFRARVFDRAPEPAYITGDLVRRGPDDTFAFVGREDRQVKVSGIRVELDEVERVIVRHPAVAQAAVVFSGAAAHARRLTGYVTLRDSAGAIDAHELHAYLRAHLPLAAIPAIVLRGELPLTTTGKVNRARLGQAAP